MASRFRRRRDAADDPSAGGHDPDNVDLDADEHAWWAQRDLSEPWGPPPAPDPTADPPRDILAEHLGADWETAFDYEAAPRSPEVGAGPSTTDANEAQVAAWRSSSAEGASGGDPAGPDEPWPDDLSDPYAVLGVGSSASWDEIVDAHRSMARRHHPDRVQGRPPAEVLVAEGRIRDINAAYQELRVRRGKH